MNDTLHVNEFETSLELDKALCQYVSKALQKEIKKEGRASLILSGGNTPKNFLKLLSKENIPWQKVCITLADERWVDTSSEDSNEKMLQESLLKNYAKNATFYPLKCNRLSAHQSEKACSEVLEDFPFPATVCILGLGEDGHTASLFPHSKELANIIYEKTLTCKACTPLKASHVRMTLTPEILGSSKKILLHITGEKKKKVLETALKQSDIFAMPIRLFLSNPKLEVFLA